MKPTTLLRLYPRAWRERYADEVLALIEQSGDHGWRLALDLILGCVSAWVAAPFDWMSPKAKQRWCRGLAGLAGWVIGLLVTAMLAVLLPTPERPWRLWISIGALFGSMSLLFFVALGPPQRSTGLVRGAPNLTPVQLLIFTCAALAFGTIAHAVPLAGFRTGLDSWLDFVMSGASPCILFQPLAVSVAAHIWPHAFRDIDGDRSHPPPSILGLGA